MRCFWTTAGIHLLGVFLFATIAVADESDDAEFAFDIFSDIAPVQGPRAEKSFIGRARENRALAEIEPMSSTSKEVCEVFNGHSIVRAMGKPKIAQFLVFPDEYDRLQAEYEKVDRTWRDSKGTRTAKPYKDKSCGIHSLKTVISTERGTREKLMEFGAYHSYSYGIARNSLVYLDDIRCRLRGLLNLSSDHFEERRIRKRHELFLAAVVAVIIQTGLIVIAVVTVHHPNIAAILGSTNKPWELPCYIAGSVLVSLGMGICSLAVERNTVEHSWKVPKRVSTVGEPEVGSTAWSNAELKASPRLLWLQQNQIVNDQSFDAYAILAGPKRQIVTSSRIEDTRKRSKKHESVVGSDSYGSIGNAKDQAHNRDGVSNITTWEILTVLAVLASALGFVAQFIGLRGLAFPCSIAQLVAIFAMALIRAGIRRRLGIVTAHRSALAKYELDFLATHIVFCPKFHTFHKSTSENEIYTRDRVPGEIYQWKIDVPEPRRSNQFYFKLPAEVVTVPSPDAVSLDDADGPDSENVSSNESKLPAKKQLTAAGLRRQISGSISTMKRTSGPYFEPASSQQLVRVRERLGDLCGWTSKASESALSLVQSIELFMNTFFPPPDAQQTKSLNLNTVDWVFETINPETSLSGSSTLVGGRNDFIVISVKRSADPSKWEVEIGMVDAALSLWMASIEANALEEQKKSTKNNSTTGSASPKSQMPDSNWRRTKAGSGMRYKFCRILGDNFKDGVLKRDLSWWVDELIADQSDLRRGDVETMAMVAPDDSDDSSDASGDEIDRGSERDDQNSVSHVRWHPSRARGGCVDFVIGFNGRPDDVELRRNSMDDEARELGIVSSAFPPTILAQHLFTSFMWTVVEKWPKDYLHQGFGSSQQDIEIESRQAFDPYDFSRTWRRPKLRHRQLTKIVRQMENYGLGSITDILLCIIPAFSFKDLLPNHIILKLLPQIGQGQGWEETARCYNRLLQDTSIRTDKAETFCYSVVINAMDFLYLACEPYDECLPPPRELNTELCDIVATLIEPRFARVIKTLAPIYNLQHRRRAFEFIFRKFKPNDEKNECLAAFQPGPKPELDQKLLKDILGFSAGHITIYSAIQSMEASGLTINKLPFSQRKMMTSVGTDPKDFVAEGAISSDIFGWTPLHYACLASPVHIAALGGKQEALGDILEKLSDEDKKNAINQGGLDGMTPFHLASSSGNLECLGRITDMEAAKHMLTIAKTDVWGREAIHIAASIGDDKIATKLLELGAIPDRSDDTGKSPVDYLLKRKPDDEQDSSRSSMNEEAGGSNTSAADEQQNSCCDSKTTAKSDERSFLSHKRCKILQKFALKKRDYRNRTGQTFLHIAVEVADEDTVGNLLFEGFPPDARDSQGRTSLHGAILAGRTDMALALIAGFKGIKAEPSARDNNKTTALMFAARQNLQTVAETLLRPSDTMEVDQSDPGQSSTMASTACSVHDKDDLGLTALHYALDADISNNKAEAVKFMVKKGLLNEADSVYHEPPLSWACEEGNREVVEILVKHPDVDVNQRATGWRNYSPLRFAVARGDEEVLGLLLGAPSVRLDLENAREETPLEMAVGLFEDVLKCVGDESFTDKDLLALISASEEADIPKLFELFMMRALKRDTWKLVKNPYHLAVQVVDNLTLVEALTQKGADPTQLDEDNWSCIDYAVKLGRPRDFLNGLIEHVQQHAGAVLPSGEQYRPTDLLWTEFNSSIQVTPCRVENHSGCTGFHGVQVLQELPGTRRACLRSDHCIPPSTKEKAYFYFEVRILSDSNSRILGLGGSWAYHGDDGYLFVDSGWGVAPSADFGAPGNAFEGKKPAAIGKIYPCVGFSTEEDGVGLHFEVNFGCLPDRHPFEYKGPLYLSLMEKLLRKQLEINRRKSYLKGLGDPKKTLPPLLAAVHKRSLRKFELELEMLELEVQLKDYKIHGE
ncbi:hypothetical protein B0H66DRAFT_527778 [Apodospora peruviana]|uniref:Protein SSH4 n=1 Tax=Apodospora peruviana TaxID=516989 RepID=A0AAE0MFC7_9PEZI|nr:hypothetical protein B0H66DRAFT_527778 [Apodospora peruviana]